MSISSLHFPVFLLSLVSSSSPPTCLSVMVKDGVQEAQTVPDGTDGDAGPINTHGRADRLLPQSPAWILGTQVGRGERKDDDDR